MKELNIVSSSPADEGYSSCCTQASVPFTGRVTGLKEASVPRSKKDCGIPALPFVEGVADSPVARVPIVTSKWTRADRLNAVRCRLSQFRMRYTVPPGLYAIGRPGASSEIFVSANYKLSFDILRRSLAGIDGWILVLDTSGINVWCAAGEGTFGTDELIRRIRTVKLSALVSHRRLILPQLGAVGVSAHEVQRNTGFRIYFGPVEANHIPLYLANGREATPSMRLVRFGWKERLILTPMELIPALKKFPLVAVIILAVFGMRPEGIMYNYALSEGMPFLILTLAAILSGAFITPLLLPVIPSRSFAVKGWITGMAAIAPIVILTSLFKESSWLLKSSALVLFPLLSSYLGLQFTGATTFTGISGVKKEIRIAAPIYAAGALIVILLITLHKLTLWGLL